MSPLKGHVTSFTCSATSALKRSPSALFTHTACRELPLLTPAPREPKCTDVRGVLIHWQTSRGCPWCTRHDVNPAGEALLSLTTAPVKTLCAVLSTGSQRLASQCNPGSTELEDEPSTDCNPLQVKLPWQLGGTSGVPKRWQS